MKVIASGRLGQVAARYGEQAPVATACCNACRTCVTSNVLALAAGALGALGVGVSRLWQRARADG